MLKAEVESQPDPKIISENQMNQSGPEKFIAPLEKPRTANKAFGGISDFLLFFENRNPEIKEFVQDFKKIERMDSELSIKELNTKIAPKVQNCVNKMHKKIGTRLKNKYFVLFTSPFETLEAFYKKILFAYTIAGFLYEKMNEFLRKEDWGNLDDLLPYTYSLFKAFLWGPTVVTFSKNFEFLKSLSYKNKLILYRGAGFDEASLKYYDKDKITYFSWNGVTSTSLDKSQARRFQGEKSETKNPVLITIEVDFENLNPQNLNALYLEELSEQPREKEVAFAPGSIFELVENKAGSDETEITLKLVTNAKILAQQGNFLHGMLQGVMRDKDELRLVCLKEKELSRAMKHCRGNQLVAKLVFSLCHFNRWSVKALLDVLPTIKNLSSFTFNSVILEEECLDQILKCLGDLKLEKLEVINSLNEENNIKSFIGCIKYFGSFKILKLSFEENSKIGGFLMREIYNEAVQYLDPGCVFELNMINDCDIVVKGLNISNNKQNFGKRLNEKWPIKLESSSKKIEENYFSKFRDEEELIQVIDAEQKGIILSKEKFERESENSSNQESTLNLIGKKELFGYSLGDNSCFPKRTLLEALEDKYILSQPSVELKDPAFAGKQLLETLSMNFEAMRNRSEKDIMSFGCEKIQCLQSLKTLHLNFNDCNEITDRALEVLSNDVLRKLTGLNTLHLSLEGCKKITDEGLERLACDGIQHLPSLTELNLRFRGCDGITNEGLRSLSLEGIAKIKSSLTSLHLSFESCKNITDEGLENLFHVDGFESLTSLGLNFNNCSKITNKGIEVLSYKGFQKCKKHLEVLILSFDKCYEITDEGLRMLSCEGISHLESLTSLSLSFFGGWGSKVTDKGIASLYDKGIQHLGSLVALHLTFDECRYVTNEGFESLNFPNGLMTLHLSFNDCKEITDDGLDSLSKKLCHLKSLEHLHLGFRNCAKITDKGLGFLCSQGIRPLSKLNALHLRFGIIAERSYYQEERCTTITNQSLKSIGSEAIKHLPELKTLRLDLEGCKEVTVKGLEDLCSEGIQRLEKLTDLHLSFFGCESLNDEGLEILSHQGIFPLKNSLKNLYLNFRECNELSDMGLKSLWDGGIQYLWQLTTLNLKFASHRKIKISHLLQIQYQINRLNFPQLQLPLEVPLRIHNEQFHGDWAISSPCYQFSNDPNTAYVLCQDRLGFTPKASTNVIDDIEPQGRENLALKFENGPDITDLDISNSLFSSDKMKTFRNLKTLHLTFDECILITDFTLHNLCSQGLQNIESLSSLHLSFNGCYRITDAGMESLGSIGIKHLKLLTSLSLSFNGCQLITNQGLRSLIEIKHLELLDTLHLDFGVTNITDQGLIDLSRSAIQYIKSLTSLSLHFDDCQITNKGLRELYHCGLRHLESLKFMHLSFQLCEKITSKGLKRLYHKGMKSLTSFFIDFPGTKITERLKKQLSQSSSNSFIIMSKNSLNSKLIGTSHFMRQKIGMDQVFSHIQPISEDSVEIVENKMFTRYLGRNHYVFNTHELEYFDETCYEDSGSNVIENIDDIFKSAKKDIIALRLLSGIPELEEKVKKLIEEKDDQKIKYLESLTSLTLVLGGWDKYITDSALSELCSSILQHLKALTNLSLSFNGCDRLTNTGFMNLGYQGIRYLTSLTTLHLNFNKRVRITDVELKTLSREVIKGLESLTTLCLNFEECEDISDTGLQGLWTDGILHLKSLKTLDLGLEKCSQITGVGFNDMNSPDDDFLPLLAIFRINLDDCVDFNDKGVESLCVGVIQRLKRLTTLHLNFDGNEKITDSSLEYLSSQGICYLESLENLHLSFDRCWHITDKGVQNLNLSSFKSLTSLYLNFDRCYILTDQSLKDLTSQLKSLKILHLSFRGCSSAVTEQALENLGIQHLTSLEALYLSFDGCKKITDEGIKALCQNRIQSLGLLKTLHLSFAWCEQITEKGLEILSNDGIRFLAELENIHICFLACEKISHDQLSSFQAQINLPHLQQRPLEIIDNTIFSEAYLHNQRFLSTTIPSQEYINRLEVSAVDDIYDETGISDFGLSFKDRFYPMSKLDTNLKVDMLQKLQKNKTLRFEDNFHATDFGISSNCSYCLDNMENFKNLQMLKITINNSEIIKDFCIKIRSLCRNVLQRLKSLKILHISFEMSNEMTDHELKILSFEGISSLAGLIQLYLSFNGCKNITDEGLMSLSSGGIQNLKQLNVLSLSLNGCDKITDRGLTSLCSEGIQYLKLLKTLHLSFDGCNKITDEVLKSVSLVGILNLSSIRDLQLSFLDCPRISSSSYQAFLKILEYFGYVEDNQDSKNI